MEINIVDTTLLQVRELLEQDKIQEALRLIEALLPADRADVFEELPPEQQQALLPQLDTGDAADLLEELEDIDAAQLVSAATESALLDAGALADIVDEMEPDEAADLLGDLSPSLTTATLAQMEEADEVRPLLLHPDQTAGGLMTSEYLAFPQTMRASRVLATLREWEPKSTDTPYLFVVDAEGHLVGVANIFTVLRADPTAPLASLMDPEVTSVQVSDDQESVARLMARYDLSAVPVVNEQALLVGVITVDDLVEVLEDEATEDIQRIGGTAPLDRPYLDSPVPAVVWKRLGWLLMLFVTGTLTGSVLRMFEDEIGQMVSLAFFVPLLIGTGGNAGSQTTSTVIRALGVGEIDLGDALRVLWHEFRVGFLLAALMAIAGFVRAVTWGTSMPLALVVSGSIFGIVVWADSVGSLLPLLAARLRIDPAVVSGPFMSTLVDATGLLIYFTIAQAILGI